MKLSGPPPRNSSVTQGSPSPKRFYLFIYLYLMFSVKRLPNNSISNQEICRKKYFFKRKFWKVQNLLATLNTQTYLYKRNARMQSRKSESKDWLISRSSQLFIHPVKAPPLVISVRPVMPY